MAKKDARAGGKFGGGHTTVIPAAGIVADIAKTCRTITKISPGFIKAGLPTAKGRRRVKIASVGGGLLLSVRDNTSHQELRVYADDVLEAQAYIAREARKAGLVVNIVV
jgi:hypothetical protein